MHSLARPVDKASIAALARACQDTLDPSPGGSAPSASQGSAPDAESGPDSGAAPPAGPVSLKTQQHEAVNPWPHALERLRDRLGAQTYEHWLRPMVAELVAPATLRLAAPNGFARDWFEAHFLPHVRDELERLASSIESIEVIVGATEAEVRPDTPGRDGLPAPLTTSVPTPPSTTPIESAGSRSSVPPAGGTSHPSPSHKNGGRGGDDARPAAPPPQGLSARYRFDAFICAASNELAASAAKAVAERPGERFNPLFIYGGVGLGKTHLLHAIGHEISARQPQLRICLVSAERFMNEFVTAVRHSRFDEFRGHYRDECDVLLVDDIQFIAGRDRTMDEFFHVFNALFERNKQIVVTADRVPADMAGMEARLTSRLNWGLVADIQAPDLETRIAILSDKLDRDPAPVPMAAVEAIASLIPTNIRELEGALMRVTAVAALRNVRVTPELVRQTLRGADPVAAGPAAIDGIQKLVAHHFGLRVAELKGTSRSRSVTQPRMIAMYLCRVLTSASLPEIGHRFCRDHTTVLHAYRKIGQSLEDDAQLHALVTDLRARLERPQGPRGG